MSWWVIALMFSPALLLWGALELLDFVRARRPLPPTTRREARVRDVRLPRASRSRTHLSAWELIARGMRDGPARWDDRTIERIGGQK